MNPVLTVSHVLTLFPHRKKSWAYRELGELRENLGRKFVTLADLAQHLKTPLSELQGRLSQPG